MKKRLLFLASTFLLAAQFLVAQISNTETTIMLASSAGPPYQVCPWNNIPSSSAGNVYQVYITFEDGDDFANQKRLPATGYYNCTVTNTPNSFGPNIFIDAPTAAFPTPSNTAFGWSLVDTKGKVTLLNTTTNTTTHQIFEYDQYTCPALPIYLAYFRLATGIDYGSSGVNFLKFEWQAVDESDYLSHYILQKSYNNFTWTNEVLEPAVTGAGIHNYVVYANKHDNNPNVWYRLKWIGEYGFAKTSQSIKPTGIAGTGSNIVCNYTNVQGPVTICANGSAVYKIHNVPASAGTYTWSANGATINYVNQNNLMANVSFGTTDATLYVNPSSGSCSRAQEVAVDTPTGPLTINQDLILSYPTYTRYYLSVETIPNTSEWQYSWFRNGLYVGDGESKMFDVYSWCDEIEVRYENACNQSIGTTTICFFPVLDPCDPWDPARTQDLVKVGPVPANDKLTISFRRPPPCLDPPVKTTAPQQKTAMSSDIYTVQLYDMFGNLKLERKNVSLKTEHQLDVYSLPTGNYILYLKNARNVISKQVRIER